MPPRRAQHRRRPGGPLVAFLHGRRGVVAVATALVAVLTAAVVALLLGGERAGGTAAETGPVPGPAGSPPPGTAQAPAPGTPAAELVEWAGRELPEGARLRPEEDIRGALLDAGVPENLLTAGEPAGAGGLLLTVTAGEPDRGSRVVARLPGVTVADPSPGTATPEQLDRRKALAAAVLANPTTRAPAEAAAVLRAADVDMRLMSLLAVLTAREGIAVAAFPRAHGAEGPARSVLLDGVGGAPIGTGEVATESLRAFLAAQLPPFAPDRVDITDDGVLLSYRYASDPDALVDGASR